MDSGNDQSQAWSMLSASARDALDNGIFARAEMLYRDLLAKVPSTDENVPMLKSCLCEALAQQQKWDQADQLDMELLEIVKGNAAIRCQVADFFIPRREWRGTLLYQQAKGDLATLRQSERVLKEAYEASVIIHGEANAATVALSSRLKSVRAWVRKAEGSKLKRHQTPAKPAQPPNSSGDRGRREERPEQKIKPQDKVQNPSDVPSISQQKQNHQDSSVVAKAGNGQAVGPVDPFKAFDAIFRQTEWETSKDNVTEGNTANNEKEERTSQRAQSKNGNLSPGPLMGEKVVSHDKNFESSEQQKRARSRDNSTTASKPDHRNSINGLTRQSGESLVHKDQLKNDSLSTALVLKANHDTQRMKERASSVASPQSSAPNISSPPVVPQKPIQYSPAFHRNSSPSLPTIALEPPNQDNQPTAGKSPPSLSRLRSSLGSSAKAIEPLSPALEDAIAKKESERAQASVTQQPTPVQPLLQLTLSSNQDTQLAVGDKSQQHLCPPDNTAATGSQSATPLSRSRSVDHGQNSKSTIKSRSALILPIEGAPESEQKKRTRSLSQGRDADRSQPSQGEVDHTNFNVHVETNTTSEQERRVNAWFKDMQKVDDFMSQRRSKRDKPVKVAILDTGFNTSHSNPEVQAVWEKITNFGKVRSWVDMSNRKNVEDLNGHGTHCAMSFSTIAPAAKLHIGQVCIHGSDVNQDSVAKAIDHCVKKWEVDIISMSFGFDTINIKDSLKEAINLACASNILIFAAAGNDGRGRRLTYPARHEKVFCVFAANADGVNSGFNPDPFRNDYRFCTLGEHVRMPRTGVDSVVLSGTSVATPIAAAFAALVLEFISQDPVPGQFPIQNVEKLRTKQGMSMIFLEMQHSNRAKLRDSRWHHLEPWNFLTVREGDTDELERRRISVPFYINEALKEVD